MKKILTIYIFAFIFLSDMAIYAQSEENENGNLEGDDPAPAPINGKIILLVIFGLLLAYHAYTNNKKAINK